MTFGIDRIAAPALALLGAALTAAGCHHPVLSDAEIAAYCQEEGTGSGACVETFTRLRDDAEAVGCGAEYATYFRCTSNPDPPATCGAGFAPVDACGHRHDPHSLCILADEHWQACGVQRADAPGLCDGDVILRCGARCVLGVDCDTLHLYETSATSGSSS